MANFSVIILTAAPPGAGSDSGGAFVKIDGRESLLRAVEMFLNRDNVKQIQLVFDNDKIEEGKRIPLDVKTGDRILFGKYTGSDITIDDQEYLILREEEILAKVSGIAKAASGKK